MKFFVSDMIRHDPQLLNFIEPEDLVPLRWTRGFDKQFPFRSGVHISPVKVRYGDVWNKRAKHHGISSSTQRALTYMNELDLYNWKGLLVGRKMPHSKLKRGRGKDKTKVKPASKIAKWWRNNFKAAVQNYKFLGPEDLRAWHNFVIHSSSAPKDAFTSMYLKTMGNLPSFPPIVHLSDVISLDGSINAHFYSQNPCFAKLHFWVAEDEHLYEPIVWWYGSSWSGGLKFPHKTKSAWVEPRIFDSHDDFSRWHFFDLGTFEPGYYPVCFVVTTYDRHHEYRAHSGLYFLNTFRDYLPPHDIHTSGSGPFDCPKTWWYVNNNATIFPAMSENPPYKG